MTIRRGEAWGSEGSPDDVAGVAGSDASLARLVAGSRATAGASPAGPFLLTGGDLHRTLGAPRPDPERTVVHRFDCDVVSGTATTDDGAPLELLAVAHVLGLPLARGFARRRERPGRVVPAGDVLAALWNGPSFVAANAAFVGDANLGPRAHPGDGLLDVSCGSMDRRDRRTARARMLVGAHLPHPGVVDVRTRSWASPPGVRYLLVCDGLELGVCRDIRLVVLSDAVLVAV